MLSLLHPAATSWQCAGYLDVLGLVTSEEALMAHRSSKRHAKSAVPNSKNLRTSITLLPREPQEVFPAHSKVASDETLAHLQEALEAASMLAWSWDLKNNEVTQSANAAEILGCNADRPYRVHLEMDSDIDPRDRNRYSLVVENSIRSCLPYMVQYRLIRSENAPAEWFEEHGRVLVGEGGEPSHLRGVLFNISEQKRTEEALLVNHQRLLSFIAGSSDPVVVISDHGTVDCISDVGASLLGYRPEELVGISVESMVHHDDIRLALPRLTEICSEKGSAEALIRAYAKTGAIRWLDVEVSIILPNSSSRGFLAKIRNVDIRQR